MTPESRENDGLRDSAPEDGEPIAEFVVNSIEWEYDPEELAPPVDEERLIRYGLGPVSDEEAKEVLSLMKRFRSWNEAMDRLLREHRRWPSAEED